HQSTNKISPVEALLEYAMQDLAEQPQRARTYIERSQQALAGARSILLNFQNYASDKPFPDRGPLEVGQLLRAGVETIRALYPALAAVEVAGAVPAVRVQVSRAAMLEVFEVLAHNSLLHGGKRPQELRLTLAAEVLPADRGVRSPTGR